MSLLIDQLTKIRKERKDQIDEIEKTFGPIDQLVPYYVIPDAQNVNPADVAEDDTGLVARTNVFELLDKFLSGSPRFSHALVLSDAGMGKTSLLVMLNLFYLNKFIKPDFELRLFKIGPKTMGEIEKISKPHETVLLLDALDEDAEAWQHFYTRLQMLLQSTNIFRKVIITCRTQFFPREHEEDGRVPGQIILSGFHCSKIFLSPFDDDQVDQYLKKKFKKPEEITRANNLVQQMQSLKFRPMLLSYIDFLIEHDQYYNNAYSVYETLVEEWLNREMRKGVVNDKQVLRDACFILANNMYMNKFQTLPSQEVMELCRSVEGVRHLEHMTIEGRSLLHRTSEGGYKFAHYSILEFFVATSLINNPELINNSDQVISFIADMIGYRGLKKASGLDLKRVVLANKELDSTTFNGSNLIESDFRNSSLKNSVFKNADLSFANFEEAKLNSANLRNSKCKGTVFKNADLSAAILEDVDFSECNMQFANLSGARLHNSDFSKVNLESADLTEIKSAKLIFEGANLTDSQWKNTKIPGISLRNSVLNRANLEGVDFSEGILQSAKLEHACMVGAMLDKCQFNSAIMHNADGTNAKMRHADFKDIKATNCSFQNVECDRSNFETSELSNSNFSNAVLNNSSFFGAVLLGVNFENCSLINVIFEKSEGNESIFIGANLIQSVFRKAKFNLSNFSKADLSNTKFDNTQIKNAIFNNTKITNASFDSALLQGARFEGNSMINVDFTSANLQGASFRRCKLIEVNFSKSILNGVIFDDCIVVSVKSMSLT